MRTDTDNLSTSTRHAVRRTSFCVWAVESPGFVKTALQLWQSCKTGLGSRRDHAPVVGVGGRSVSVRHRHKTDGEDHRDAPGSGAFRTNGSFAAAGHMQIGEDPPGR